MGFNIMIFISLFKKIIILYLLQLSLIVYAENKEIKLVTLEWEPYVGSNLKKQGFISELIRSALKKEGYTLKLEFMPWARALDQAEKSVDGIDGIMPKYYDKSILDKFIYSDSFFESTDGFYIKKAIKVKLIINFIKMI
jgi:polar amino acid transport system substrate-binding protein